ncbi:MAG: D-alanine--D-alanine ligase [bacterium]
MTPFTEKIIGVVMGGESAEREISLKSGSEVAKALSSRGYDVREVVVDAGVTDQLRIAGIDVAFLALHGGWGEDGRVQALCEMLKIPYTGSGVLASALAMNKAQAKSIFVQNRIPTPAYCPALSREFVFETMGFKPPLVLKPTMQGSTVGVSIIRKEREFEEALSHAKEYDETPMVEEYVPGKEMTVGVLSGEPLGVVEIVPRSGFYDYSSKYTEGASEYIASPEMPAGLAETMRDLAGKAYEALGCRGGARVDFRLDEETGEPWVLELNTIPGMTRLSLLPRSAEVLGIGFEDLCEKMLEDAVSRR